MAGNLTDYLEQAYINWLRGSQMPTPPGTLYIALFTTATDDTGAGTEVSGGGYARAAIALSAPGAAGAVSNAAQVPFPIATGSWGTVTHAALMSAASGGNMLVQGILSASKAIASGERFVFDPTQVAFTLG